MRTLEEFQRFYESDLRPALEGLETRRAEVHRKMVRTQLTSLVVLVGLVVVMAFISVFAAVVFAFIGLVVALIIAVLVTGPAAKRFVSDFKQEVVGRIVRFLDPSLAYTPGGHISEGQFRESLIFPDRIDRFHGEDLVTGKVGATALEFSELHAEHRDTHTDSKGHTHTEWRTIFKGLFFIADFNKDFRGTTLVLPDVAESLMGSFGTMLQKMNFTRPGKLVRLEDPEFEKHFVVYGTDQVESRYILSMSLMERIKDFKRKTGKALCLSFVHSNVHVALTTGRNMFEPRLSKTVLDFALVRQYFEDLQFAIGIVDDLNLNTRIWSKA